MPSLRRNLHSCSRPTASILRLAPIACVFCLLNGCSIVHIQDVQPMMAPPDAAPCSATNPHYQVPHLQDGRLQNADFPDFDHYIQAVRARAADKLPGDIAKHPVTKALVDFLATVFGEAQLEAQISDGAISESDAVPERAEMRKYTPRQKFKRKEMEGFTTTFALGLVHGPADFTTTHRVNLSALPPSQRHGAEATRPYKEAFVQYMDAYYQGKFYSRTGFNPAPPTLPNLQDVSTFSNVSISDTEIDNAETVLLEFLVDCIDPTPVMTDASGNYYPGKFQTKPTALTTGLAQSVTLTSTECGVNLNNVWVLQDLTQEASAKASAIGGLTVNAFGGFSVGLGILGNFSVGDNQTLSNIVKTAVSELALRITLACSYAVMQHVRFTSITLEDKSPRVEQPAAREP